MGEIELFKSELNPKECVYLPEVVKPQLFICLSTALLNNLRDISYVKLIM